MLNAKVFQLTNFSEKATFKSYSTFRSFSRHASHAASDQALREPNYNMRGK